MNAAFPVARQVAMIRQRYPDTILLFRLGDFFEAHAEDARTVSRVLDTSVATRKDHNGSRTDVTGFPYSVLAQSVTRLVDAGYRVAVCDQTGI